MLCSENDELDDHFDWHYHSEILIWEEGGGDDYMVEKMSNIKQIIIIY